MFLSNLMFSCPFGCKNIFLHLIAKQSSSEKLYAKMNHIRRFINIPFTNKGINFIDLPSIFRDKTVESSIPDYFEIKEPFIICYKYNKPFRFTILNFNKLVADLDIDTKTPDS